MFVFNFLEVFMKIKILFPFIALSMLTVSTLANSAQSVAQLCNSEFDIPMVTPKNDGSFYVCTSHPAAYVTNEQAKVAATGINTEQARAICRNEYPHVVRSKALARYYSVTVISLFICR